MRLIVIYKSPVFHLRRERLDVDDCSLTDGIITLLEKKLGWIDAIFVFRIILDNIALRLVKGWPV